MRGLLAVGLTAWAGAAGISILTPDPAPVADPWPTALSAAVALEHREAAATFTWIGQTGRYAAALDSVPPDFREQTTLACESALELDPRWPVPIGLGALMLGERGDPEGEQILMRRGSEAFPDETWFQR